MGGEGEAGVQFEFRNPYRRHSAIGLPSSHLFPDTEYEDEFIKMEGVSRGQSEYNINRRREGEWPGGGAECEYIILPGPGVCNLNLDLSWFFIKQTFNCTEEYLDVMGSRLCGDLTGKEGI